MTTAMSSREDQRAALIAAHDFYRRHLRGSWVPEYLTSRGLGDQLEPARLGYAPNTWSALTDTLHRAGHDHQVLLDAGLTRASSAGTLIDTLRDRLVVPVTDDSNQLVGFTGRSRPDADPDTPKWLNSPGTELFHKRQLLYALGEDLPALHRGATPVFVEGAMDRLAVKQASGHVQVVALATLGTALTHDHTDTLVDHIGHHRPIAVCFDNDPAGQKATLAAWHLLSRSRGHDDGTLLHIALPAGHDPASLVETGQTDQLHHQLLRPTPLANVVADIRINQAGDLAHLGRRILLARELVQDVPHLHRSAVSGYLAHLVRQLDLDHEIVTTEALQVLDGPDPEAVRAHTATSAASPAPSQPGSEATPSSSARTQRPRSAGPSPARDDADRTP